MNMIQHRSFWTSCSKCGRFAWDIYMYYSIIRTKKYICIFCALGDSERFETIIKPTKCQTTIGMPVNMEVCNCGD